VESSKPARGCLAGRFQSLELWERFSHGEELPLPRSIVEGVSSICRIVARYKSLVYGERREWLVALGELFLILYSRQLA
jgi:hypothetical protein